MGGIRVSKEEQRQRKLQDIKNFLIETRDKADEMADMVDELEDLIQDLQDALDLKMGK